MSVKSAGVGLFTIPTAPAAGTSITGGAANAYSASYVQLIASTAAAIYITGVQVSLSSTSKPTYMNIQLATGGAGSETIVGQIQMGDWTTSGATGTVVSATLQFWPPIPVANATRIAAKVADSVGSLAWLVSLQCVNQSNVVDAGIVEQADVQTIKTQTVTCSAGVTVGAFVGNATAALGVDASGRVDLGKALGTAVTLDSNNVLNVSTKYVGGTLQTAGDIYSKVSGLTFTVANQVDVNAKSWAGGTIPATNVTGVPLVDAKYLLGTIFATPATAGIIDVNIKNVNNVAYASSTLSTLASHDPGATLGTSTLTQAQVTGGAYALSSASFAFNAALDFTTAQKTSLNAATPASVTGAVGSVTGNVGGNVNGNVQGNVMGGVGFMTTSGVDSFIDEMNAYMPWTAQMDVNNYLLVDVRQFHNLCDFNATMKTDLNAATPIVTLADGAITDAKFALPSLTAPATGAVGMLQQLWRRFFKKAVLDSGAGKLRTYADDDTTVVTTQDANTVSGVETQGVAT